MTETQIAIVVLGFIALAVLVWVRTARTGAGSEAEALRGALEQLREIRVLADTTRSATTEALAQMRREAAEASDRTRTGLAGTLRDTGTEQRATLESFQRRLDALSEGLEKRFETVRTTVESRLKSLEEQSGKKLDEMRGVVEKKLEATLSTRLSEAFAQVSKRLEEVQKGLSEMQKLASDVGSLNRTLSNVKTRGIFGEVQLAAILEEFLLPEQYAANVRIKPRSNEHVEFAVKLPGQGDEPVYLAIDSKFPREDYERLLDAAERGDKAAVEAAGKALEERLWSFAREIRDKYVAPPHSTDFAILFLPTEGLFAEAARRPGLLESLMRECRTMVAGPTTISALLSSLRMGFRTLAIEKRSAEVWKLLSAVRTQFEKFGGEIERVQKTLEQAQNQLGRTSHRARQIDNRLKEVETLPASEADRLLPEGETAEDPDAPDAPEAPEANGREEGTG